MSSIKYVDEFLSEFLYIYISLKNQYEKYDGLRALDALPKDPSSVSTTHSCL